MIRRLLCFLLALVCFPYTAFAESVSVPESSGFVVSDLDAEDPEKPADYPPAEYEFTGKRLCAAYSSDTVIYSIESFTIDNALCLLTKVWVRDPQRQIRKVNAPWGKSLSNPLKLAQQIPETVLATNASGYITKQYPDIPESYPGVPSDYFFTTLGSLVITDGEILRNLEGVPFYGLALSENGIELFRGADNEMVLASSPRQTWAFFESCAMMVNGEDVLPEEGAWPMAREQHPRTVLARVNRNNYLMLHVPNRQDSHGLSLYQINRFFMRNFETEWVYNLDGGYSTALICKTQEKNARLTRIAPNRQPAADILCITD